MAEEERKGKEREKEKDTALQVLGGALIGGGLVELIHWLTREVHAAPPGATVVTPDEWTKQLLLGMLAELAEISGKLDTEIGLLTDIKCLLGGELPTAKYDVREIPHTLVSNTVAAELYISGEEHSGSVIAFELVSDSKDIEYELHLDDIVWTFNVSNMIESSIEYPHFPGAWIAKATGAMFVLLFSSGAAMDVRYRKYCSLLAKATTTTDVNISRGEIIRRVYELG